MSDTLMVSVSGMRGHVGSDLTPELVARHAAALGTWVRRNANVVLTNPEMLHCGLLPHHERWATFLMRLRYVVIDELHVLRGVFGTHVGHVLRRLLRLCEHYGSRPTFAFSSATIGSPDRLASELIGAPMLSMTTSALAPG